MTTPTTDRSITETGRTTAGDTPGTEGGGMAWAPPLGANVGSGGVRFGVWAPEADRIDVRIEGDGGPTTHPMTRAGDGTWDVTVPGIGAGARYRFVLGDQGDGFPDPYSRSQPDGVHGASEVIDPATFAWTDSDWPGLSADGQVIYEVHVGTMTPEGTFAALAGQLPELKRLGVTVIELMPVAQSSGRWNWGYDGVDLFAPNHAYGRPDDLRRLVDTAHGLGLGVILDVVYNHFGPEGNYLRAFSEDYFTDRHMSPWGEGINYDGPEHERVRELAISNALAWVAEYHMDGFRLDATDAIIDDSPVHLVAELTARARELAAPRSIAVYAEDARNDVSRIRPVDKGGEGLDGVWADDFHHEVRVLLTGGREGYFQDYEGSTKGIAHTLNDGFGYQGEMSPNLGHTRGTRVTDEPASAFVFCIQNHDQVGNRPFGDRLHHDVALDRYAAASALLLLAPETPLLFMGQEFAASTPFLYFTDHSGDLGGLVTEGRRAEFKGFAAFADADLRHSIPDPQAELTFTASKLDLAERETNAGIYRLYQDLLALRRDDPVLAVRDRSTSQAGPVGARAVALVRQHGDARRLLVANFGAALTIRVAHNPLLAKLPEGEWTRTLSTADERYGGPGTVPSFAGTGDDRTIEVPARSAALFRLG